MSARRVGIIGLNADSWAANAHLPYLQSEQQQFQVVAVCNSSADSARRAIKDLNLPASTKAYGDPEELARDSEVDLVVCTVRVDRHASTISPAIKAGKDVMVEWPLGKNLQEAEELLELSRAHKTRLAAVGCQGRFDSSFQTVRKLLQDGRIGQVLSTTMNGAVVLGGTGGVTFDPTLEYLTQMEVGGNLVTIPFGHFIDSFIGVIDKPASYDSILAVQRPTVTVVSPDQSVAPREVKATAHDHLMLHGTLASGAVFSINVRSGNAFKNEPGLDWRIHGEKGEILVTAPNVHMQIFGATSIQLHDFATDEVEQVEQVSGDEFSDWPPIHRNVARLYQAIADKAVDSFCTFEQAVERHRLIDALYKQNGVSH